MNDGPVSASVTVDTAVPVTSSSHDAGCYDADFTVVLTAIGTNITYSVNGGGSSSEASPVSIDVNAEGDYAITYAATDYAGNAEASRTLNVTLDKTLPVTTPSVAAGTYGAAQAVSLSVVDTNLETTYAERLTAAPAGGYTPTAVYSGGNFDLADGGVGSVTNYWLVYYAVDCAGNAEDVHVDAYVIDTNVPVTTVSFDPEPTLYDGSYYSGSAVTVTLSSATDILIHYEIVGGASDTFTTTGDLPFNTEGSYTINFNAEDTDNGLSEQQRTLTLVLDFTEPADPVIDAVTTPTNLTTQTITGTKDAHTAIVQVGGPGDVLVPIDASTTWSYDLALAEGSNSFDIVAVDAAGNSGGTSSAAIVLDTVAPFTSDHDPVGGATGQPLNKPVILHVQDAGAGVDNGTITMTVGGVTVTPVVTGSAADYTLTYTPTVNYTPLTAYTVVVDAADLAGNVLPTDTYSFTTGDTVGIAPLTIGLAEGDSFTFTASGGSLPYVWTRSPEANSSITPLTDTTAEFSATVDGPYTVTVTDDTSETAVAAVEVVDPIVIGGFPAGSAMESGTANTFTAAGGTDDPVWSADAGTIDAVTGAFTAPTVATGSQVVTITATDGTYANVYSTEDITVYALVSVTNDPGDGYMVYAGESSDDFTVAGGDGTYTWSAEGPDGGDASGALSSI